MRHWREDVEKIRMKKRREKLLGKIFVKEIFGCHAFNIFSLPFSGFPRETMYQGAYMAHMSEPLSISPEENDNY